MFSSINPIRRVSPLMLDRLADGAKGLMPQNTSLNGKPIQLQPRSKKLSTVLETHAYHKNGNVMNEMMGTQTAQDSALDSPGLESMLRDGKDSRLLKEQNNSNVPGSVPDNKPSGGQQ